MPFPQLPDSQDRQRLFHLLKKLSSITAWQRISHFYQQWANMAEASVRDAVNQGWGKRKGLPQRDYGLILNGLAHCEEGVKRLRQGNKLIFRYDANGEFVMARRPLTYFHEFVRRVQTGDSDIDLAHTPHWDAFCAMTSMLDSAWSECGPLILESQYPDQPAALVFNQPWRDRLNKLPFPDNLSPVPEPLRNTVVASGKGLPCSGIWEPVELPMRKNASSLFSRSAEALDGPLPPAGCMNYLHGGSDAPTIEVFDVDDEIEEVATQWRLIWKDDRYLDGTIPDEESAYMFTEPTRNAAALAGEHGPKIIF